MGEKRWLTGHPRPGHSYDPLVQPADRRAAVHQDAAHRIGMHIQELLEPPSVAVTGIVGQFDLDAHGVAAVFDHKIDFVTTLGAPEVQSGPRCEQAGADAQVLVDQRLEQGTQLAAALQVIGTEDAGQEDGQPGIGPEGTRRFQQARRRVGQVRRQALEQVRGFEQVEIPMG